MKAQFLNTLRAEEIDEFGGIWQLLAPLSYYSDLLDKVIVVPAEFKTDYASVPRVVLLYLLFGDKGKRAAVVHDWLYSGGLVDGVRLDRETCDKIFEEALQALGYSKFTQVSMYSGVSTFGAAYYKQENLEQPAHVAVHMDEAP